jgi:hypothetical protein
LFDSQGVVGDNVGRSKDTFGHGGGVIWEKEEKMMREKEERKREIKKVWKALYCPIRVTPNDNPIFYFWIYKLRYPLLALPSN